MPELLENAGRLEVGDVLMVSRWMREKVSGRRWEWKFFMVVTKPRRWLVRGIIVGTTNEKLKDKEMTVEFADGKNTVHYLPPDEWPDGVHVFRLTMILKGLIEDIV